MLSVLVVIISRKHVLLSGVSKFTYRNLSQTYVNDVRSFIVGLYLKNTLQETKLITNNQTKPK